MTPRVYICDSGLLHELLGVQDLLSHPECA